MKILIAGAGSIGKRHAVNAASAGLEVLLADRDKDRMDEVAGLSGGRAFDDFAAALAEQPEAVMIATPHVSHVSMARQAIAAGAHVMIEKPLSHSEEGIDDLLHAAEQKNLKVFVVCNMRFHPGVAALKQHMGRVGDIYYARAQYGEHLPTMRSGRNYAELYAAQKKEGGGIILDVIHEIDYLAWMLGPVESVIADAAKRSDFKTDVDDYASIVMRHDGGIRSEIHLDYLQQFKQRGCDIVGSKGTLLWRSESKNPERCTVRFYDALTGNMETAFETEAVDGNAPYAILMRKFIDAVKGEAGDDLLTGRQAWEGLKVALSAQEAAQADRRINIRKFRTVK